MVLYCPIVVKLSDKLNAIIMSTLAHNPTLDRSPRTKAEQALRQQILAGVLPAGMRLPAEQKLARRFGISRGTLRHALGTLQDEGLVQRRPNHGCVVADRPTRGESLLSRTVTLISNTPGGAEMKLFTGHMASINSGIVDTSQAEGLNFMLVHSGIEVQQVVDRLIAQRPYGVAISSLIGDAEKAAALVAQLRDAGVPVVIHSNEPAFSGIDRVLSDHEQGTEELVKALASAGRQRVLRLWCNTRPDQWWIAAHNRGYDDAVAQMDMAPLDAVYVPGILKRDEASRENFETRVRQVTGFLLEQYRQHNFDAVMVGTDSEVPVVASACRLIGIEPGRDVAICGYDHYWETAPERQWEPAAPFASVDKQNHLIGEEMVRLLLDRASGRLPAEAQQRVVPQRVVRFESPV